MQHNHIHQEGFLFQPDLKEQMLFLVKKAETEILVGMMYPLLGRVHHLVGMHKMLGQEVLGGGQDAQVGGQDTQVGGQDTPDGMEDGFVWRVVRHPGSVFVYFRLFRSPKAIL